jgi:leucyl aminopeptidase
MRYTVPLMAALAASATATAPIGSGKRAQELYTLETAPGETVEVTEDEKFQMIDVRFRITYS